MKHLKLFKSFGMNEGILDDMSKKDLQSKVDDDIKPFGITVNDINNIHDEKRKKYLSKFYDEYKDLSDQKLEEMLLDRIKYEINVKINTSIRMYDDNEKDYPLFKFIKDNKNNIVKRLEKAGYKVEHYKMDNKNGGWETITIHWESK
jgi:hypothetical protein